MKIAISIWTFTPQTGGLQAHAENLCKYLQSNGHQIEVITRSCTKKPIGSDYLFFNEEHENYFIDGVLVHAIRFKKYWKPLLWMILKLNARPSFTGIAAWIYCLVSKTPNETAFRGFDIIHHVGHATALVGISAARVSKKLNIPFVVQPTAHPCHFGDGPLDLKLYSMADRLLVNSIYEREYFSAKDIMCPIDVVYNGIDDRCDGSNERFRRKHSIQGEIILFLGRKSKDKGYPLLIEAFKEVTLNYPKTMLVCIGPEDERMSYQKHDHVLELSFISEDEKHDALDACMCLCVPSEGESFGLVYMEAARYKKPVICRNIPVLAELLGDKNAALLVGSRDDATNKGSIAISHVSEAITKLLENPALCKRIGDEAFKVSSQFLWQDVVCNFERSYHSSRIADQEN
jgi:glycosyltransferase involved in cell wall biosynthesis